MQRRESFFFENCETKIENKYNTSTLALVEEPLLSSRDLYRKSLSIWHMCLLNEVYIVFLLYDL